MTHPEKWQLTKVILSRLDRSMLIESNEQVMNVDSEVQNSTIQSLTKPKLYQTVELILAGRVNTGNASALPSVLVSFWNSIQDFSSVKEETITTPARYTCAQRTSGSSFCGELSRGMDVLGEARNLSGTKSSETVKWSPYLLGSIAVNG